MKHLHSTEKRLLKCLMLTRDDFRPTHVTALIAIDESHNLSTGISLEDLSVSGLSRNKPDVAYLRL